jgi:hypothetical protein
VPHFITSNCYAGCSLQCDCFSEIGLNYVRKKEFNTLVIGGSTEASDVMFGS